MTAQQWNPQLKPYTSAELVIEDYKFKTLKAISMDVLVWLRSQ